MQPVLQLLAGIAPLVPQEAFRPCPFTLNGVGVAACNAYEQIESIFETD